MNRYTISFDYLFDEDFVLDPQGEWVKYDEVSKLEQENLHLREQLTNYQLKVIRIKEIL